MLAEVTEKTFLFLVLHVQMFARVLKRVGVHCGKVSQGIPANSVLPGREPCPMVRLSTGGGVMGCSLLSCGCSLLSLDTIATFLFPYLCCRDSDMELDWICLCVGLRAC